MLSVLFCLVFLVVFGLMGSKFEFSEKYQFSSNKVIDYNKYKKFQSWKDFQWFDTIEWSEKVGWHWSSRTEWPPHWRDLDGRVREVEWGDSFGWWLGAWGLGLTAFGGFFISEQGLTSLCSVSAGLFSDPLTWVLVELSLLICPLCFFASVLVYFSAFRVSSFVFCISFTALTLLLVFTSQSLLSFYFWFEASLIPLLWLVIGWGYQPERLQAGMYLLLYTMVCSLPFLGLVGWVYGFSGSFFLWGWWLELPMFGWVIVFLPFLVKAPIYGLHSWLPKAHVEAPVAGSMLLAGLTLKLGGYGLIRVFQVFKVGFSWLMVVFIVFCMWGALLTCFICSRQDDLKSLIAYSSVSHMGLVLAGIMTISLWGWVGSVVLMVGHAFSSSGLFFLAGVLFNSFSSRSLRTCGAVMIVCPVGFLLGFALLCGNMGVPFTTNLCGEVMIVLSLVSGVFLVWPVLVFVYLFGAVYSLQLFGALFHGSRDCGVLSWRGFTFCEIFVAAFHVICMVFCIFLLDLSLAWV